MPDVFIGLKEAAEFEGVKYNTLVQRIKRNPKQYKTKTQPQEGGGKEQVLIAVASLSPKGPEGVAGGAESRREGCRHREANGVRALVRGRRPQPLHGAEQEGVL